jgi:adenylate cyclase class IV
MREVELKSIVDDFDARCRAIVEAGAVLVYEGRLEDRRYDRADGSMTRRDEVLRVRTYWRDGQAETALEWKGAKTVEDGYRVREEHSVAAGSRDGLDLILSRLGYRVTKAIDRHIVQYELHGAVVRFERYPRMDDLVEVEGDPVAIERAVAALGMPRAGFTADSLATFARRYEQRTGLSARIADEPESVTSSAHQGDGDDGTGR